MKRTESTHSEEPIHGAASSSTPSIGGDYEGGTKKSKGNDYEGNACEVFLSFRGKDTRKGFTDHLYVNLLNAGIYVFKDDNDLRVGEEISSELLRNIRQSKIAIPIISKDYTSSKWCLRELVEILKCRRDRGQIVLPIFYKLKPSQVRHLKLKDDINACQENLDEMVTKEWEEAVTEVSSLNGWESDRIDNGHEAALVQKVVRKVMSELKTLFQLSIPEQLVGIDYHVGEIMSLMDATFDDTRIIGIHGMGGIGKTTLAKVLYNKLASHFEHCSFLANIRETSQRMGIECLQKQLIFDITRSPYDVSNVDQGIHIIRSRFRTKKVLILLDDIDYNGHVDALVGDGSSFRVGSVVIITTRNRGILNKAGVGHMYQLNELPSDQSLILFSRHAFLKDFPPADYKDISRDVVSTTAGLPLALEVIGSFLCGKSKEAWQDTYEKLKNVPHRKVQEKLRISFEALDYEDQQIFLDIACFFIGSSKQNPSYMWSASGFFPRKGLEELSFMSLIKIDEDGKLMMHDQLRDLGREIVRSANKTEPQKRSRLWDYKEAMDVVDNKKGTCNIQALRLDKNGQGRSYTGEQFKGMTDLRFLQVKFANLAGDFQNLLSQLRWLQWERCPSDFTAANFHPKKLVVLNLSLSGISENWGGWVILKMATGLKVLDLSWCRSLKTTPDLSALESLEIFILEGCICLEEIHHSLGDIKTLVSLNVMRCSRLKKLPVGVGRMEKLRELLLDCIAIQEIPISMDCLMKLETLRASSCIQLAQLPESIGFLMSLTQLDLSHSGIEELPESIGSLKKLETLNVSWCASFARIPNSIGHLVALSLLDLRKCYKLAHLPESIGSLKSLQRLLLSGCHSLIEIPKLIGNLESLTELDLDSTAIAELPESIGKLQNLRILDISGTHIIELPRAITTLAKLQLRASGCENLEGLPGDIDELVR